MALALAGYPTVYDDTGPARLIQRICARCQRLATPSYGRTLVGADRVVSPLNPRKTGRRSLIHHQPE
jgi:hypothetical protein